MTHVVSGQEVAAQIERDFDIPHPLVRMRTGLKKRDTYHEVTPFHRFVAQQRLDELAVRGFGGEDACLILMMRGARIEALAETVREETDDLVSNLRSRLRELSDHVGGDLDRLICEALRTLRLMDRA